MKTQLESILFRYGQEVTLTKRDSGEALVTQAFLQPVLKKQEPAPITVTPLGAVSRQRWVYIGSGDIQINPGDQVDHGGLALQAQEARAVYCGGTLLYYWALLHLRKETAV